MKNSLDSIEYSDYIFLDYDNSSLYKVFTCSYSPMLRNLHQQLNPIQWYEVLRYPSEYIPVCSTEISVQDYSSLYTLLKLISTS